MVVGCFGPSKEEVRLQTTLEEAGQRHKLQLQELQSQLGAARQQQAQTARELQQTALQCELQQHLNSELSQLSDQQAHDLRELRGRSARTCEELAAARAEVESLRQAARELEVQHSVHVSELRTAADEAERRAGEEAQALQQAARELKAALEAAHKQGTQLQVQLEQRGDRITDLSREVRYGSSNAPPTGSDHTIPDHAVTACSALLLPVLATCMHSHGMRIAPTPVPAGCAPQGRAQAARPREGPLCQGQ